MTILELTRKLEAEFPGGMKKEQIRKRFQVGRTIDLTDIEYFTPPGKKQRRYPADAIAKWWLQHRVPGFRQG